MIKIYCLINPLNNSVFYVGASENPNQRLKDHLRCSDKSFKSNVILQILNSGNKVDLHVLEECELTTVRKTEEFYISLFSFYGFELHQLKKSSYKDGSPVKGNNPVSLRLNEIKYDLQKEAQKLNVSLNKLVYNLLYDYVCKNNLW